MIGSPVTLNDFSWRPMSQAPRDGTRLIARRVGQPDEWRFLIEGVDV